MISKHQLMVKTPKQKTIIHIGYPKTGTKWFQKILFSNAKNYTLLDHNDIKRLIISPNSFNYVPPKELIYKLENKYTILSEENLLGSIQDGGMQNLHTKEMAFRLKKIAPDAQIIIFIRNQVSIIASAYLQYLNMGGNYSVKKYLFDKNFSFTSNRKLFSFDFFKYDETIELYISLFGEKNVFVYLYEEFASNPMLFVENFAKQHDIEFSLKQTDYKPVNKRYSRLMIPVSKFLNSFTKRPLLYKYYIIHIPKWHYISTKIKKILSSKRFFGTPPSDIEILGINTKHFICLYYEYSNKKLSKRIDSKTLEKYHYL